jgi:hypothetical protein
MNTLTSVTEKISSTFNNIVSKITGGGGGAGPPGGLNNSFTLNNSPLNMSFDDTYINYGFGRGALRFPPPSTAA